jgi:4-hydroxy-2-oxoglutarate aldolase
MRVEFLFMRLSGVLAPIPTPFDRSESLDLRRLRAALERWMATPLSGVVVLGSNGEAVLLDEEESDRMIAAARDAVPTDRAFFVGTGRESTRATIQATKRAGQLGADAVLVRTPGFFKPQMDADAFVRHYTSVADASPVPVLLYNFTALTGVSLPIDAVALLGHHPNIIGMKESGGDVQRIGDLIARSPGDFGVLAGSPSTFLPALRLGAVGGILAISAILPRACREIFERAGAGRFDEAQAIQDRLAPVAQLLSTHGVPGLKAALALTGCDVGVPRSPLARLGEAAVSQFTNALAAFEEIHGHVAS